MKICRKEQPKPQPPKLVSGRIYHHPCGEIYLYSPGRLTNLVTGENWNSCLSHEVAKLTDVTDNFCLQEI